MKRERRGLRVRLVNLIGSADVPRDRMAFLHVRLRGLRDEFGLDYAELTDLILETLWEQLSPRTILVPTYTNASFRYTGVYHRAFSRSEVGRFSEEVRNRHCRFRTPDPIYSIADTSTYLERLDGIDYTTTYGAGSLFGRLNEQDYVILNLGLEHLVSTQLHAAELAAAVPYRFVQTVSGVVYFDEQRWSPITYSTYLLRSTRIGSTSPDWDRPRVEAALRGEGVFRVAVENGTRLCWTTSQQLTDRVTALLRQDPLFLLARNGQPAPFGVPL